MNEDEFEDLQAQCEATIAFGSTVFTILHKRYESEIETLHWIDEMLRGCGFINFRLRAELNARRKIQAVACSSLLATLNELTKPKNQVLFKVCDITNEQLTLDIEANAFERIASLRKILDGELVFNYEQDMFLENFHDYEADDPKIRNVGVSIEDAKMQQLGVLSASLN